MSIPDPTTPDPDSGPSPFLRATQEDLAAQATWFWVAGIVAILAGAFAVLVPLAASLAASVLVGIVLLAVGVFDVIRAFRMRTTMRALGSGLLGVLAIVAGLILLTFPLEGVFSLTLVLIAYFLVEGGGKIIMALENRQVPRWGWVLASGIVSIALALLIWAGLPGSAIWALGLLVGINLIFYGVTLIAFVTSIRQRA